VVDVVLLEPNGDSLGVVEPCGSPKSLLPTPGGGQVQHKPWYSIRLASCLVQHLDGGAGGGGVESMVMQLPTTVGEGGAGAGLDGRIYAARLR